MSNTIDDIVTGYLVEIVRVCSDAGMTTEATAEAVELATPRVRATAEACAAYVADGHKGDLIAALDAAELPSRPAPPNKTGRVG